MPTTPIQQWLDDYCQDSTSIAGGVVMLSEPGDPAPHVVASADSKVAEPEALRSAAREALHTQAPVVRDGQPAGADGKPTSKTMSLPLQMGKQAVGAIALELQGDAADAQQPALAELERVAGTFAAALSLSVDQRASIDAGRALQLLATLLTHEQYRESATALATELATVLKVEHVAIGFREKNHTRVDAISNFADFEEGARVFRLISIAMDEAIQQGATIAYPSIPDDMLRINVAQAELAKLRGSAVCTVPIVDNGRAIGAVTLERRSDAPINMQDVATYEQIMCMVGPVLELKRQNERPWYTWLGKSFSRLLGGLIGPGHLFGKVASLVAVLGLIAGFAIKVDYRVGAPARLEGSVQRVLVSPADGFLEHAYVRPGDRVTEGQVLVELAREDLELEKRRWESELAQYENAAPAALARGDRSEFVMSQAMVNEARASLGLVEEQMERASVRSPFDGVVIMGDLSQMLGAPIRRGDTLVTVAPVDEFRLILEVDERDVGGVTLGRSGQLALGAMPGRTFEFEVSRISPVAEARDGRNYFEVECELSQSLPTMRPGLQGVARIHVDQRPVLWVLTHRLTDWLRFAVWSLGL